MKLRAFAIVFVSLSLAGSVFAVDPQLAGLAMPDARVLAGINLDQAKTSPFGQFVLSQIPTGDASFQTFVSSTGFDPTRDIREVLAATTGQPGSKTGLVAVRGSFDPSKILAFLQTTGATITPYNGVQVINAQGNGGAVAFLSNSIAVLGDPASVAGAIDRRSAGSSVAAALLGKANELSASQDAWAVSMVPLADLMKGAPAQGPGGMNLTALQKISQVSGGVKLLSNVQVSAEAVTDTPQDASALGDVVRLLSSLAQSNQSAPNAPQLQSLLQSLVVSTAGNALKLSLAIPEELVEQGIQAHHAPGAARVPKRLH